MDIYGVVMARSLKTVSYKSAWTLNATPQSSRLCSPVPRLMSTSKWPLKVSEERVQMYRARRNQYLSAAITDGDHEPEVDPYAFEEGDVKFTFSNKKDKMGGEREPGKKHKVRKPGCGVRVSFSTRVHWISGSVLAMAKGSIVLQFFVDSLSACSL